MLKTYIFALTMLMSGTAFAGSYCNVDLPYNVVTEQDQVLIERVSQTHTCERTEGAIVNCKPAWGGDDYELWVVETDEWVALLNLEGEQISLHTKCR